MFLALNLNFKSVVWIKTFLAKHIDSFQYDTLKRGGFLCEKTVENAHLLKNNGHLKTVCHRRNICNRVKKDKNLNFQFFSENKKKLVNFNLTNFMGILWKKCHSTREKWFNFKEWRKIKWSEIILRCKNCANAIKFRLKLNFRVISNYHTI